MNLATAESSRGMRRGAAAAIATMVAIAAAAIAFGRRDAVAIPATLPLAVGCVLVSAVTSAYVLFAEFARSRLVWLTFVAAAYVLTAVLAVPYLLTFPNAFAARGLLDATSQTAPYLWVLGHLLFPFAIALGAIAGGFSRGVRLDARASVRAVCAGTVAACLAIGAAATYASERAGTLLPDLIAGASFTAAATAVVLPAIVAVDACAIALLYGRSRFRSAMSIWLSIALAASALDACMGILCSRYTDGWYVGTAFFVVSSAVLLAAFIGETGRLGARLTRANEDLKRTRERERHLAAERVHRLAYYDELTGLSNRSHLEDRLRALASDPDGAFSVFFVNLDGFKEVNDQFGHAAADRVLTDVAARLTALSRPDDVVARFSGDEFVVVATPAGSALEAERNARMLRDAIRAPFELPDGIIRITASVGIATFPHDGPSAAVVLECADTSARHAKRTGGDAARFYSREFSEEARQRRRLQEDLSLALLRNEFVLLYQPIVDLRTGRTAKVEALLRWMHPERGTVLPGEFVPVAEQTGLMQLIGYWVIEEALRQARAWNAEGTPTCVCVNVSARQLDDGGFLSHLERTLGSADLPPALLELEITESAALSDASLAQDVLERCRALGLAISLDDFGTYYSSLTYLKRLPIDAVKIDRSFINGIPFVKSDTAIAAGILGLAHALDRKVVAEGIETEQQRAWLARAGCDFGQGFLFARPMSVAAFATWRTSRSRAASEVRPAP